MDTSGYPMSFSSNICCWIVEIFIVCFSLPLSFFFHWILPFWKGEMWMSWLYGSWTPYLPLHLHLCFLKFFFWRSNNMIMFKYFTASVHWVLNFALPFFSYTHFKFIMYSHFLKQLCLIKTVESSGASTNVYNIFCGNIWQ